jgi:hypothetical protein
MFIVRSFILQNHPFSKASSAITNPVRKIAYYYKQLDPLFVAQAFGCARSGY